MSNQKKATKQYNKKKLIGFQMNCKIIDHNILVAISCSDMNIETYINNNNTSHIHITINSSILVLHPNLDLVNKPVRPLSLTESRYLLNRDLLNRGLGTRQIKVRYFLFFLKYLLPKHKIIREIFVILIKLCKFCQDVLVSLHGVHFHQN